jgi:hypothetical protein
MKRRRTDVRVDETRQHAAPEAVVCVVAGQIVDNARTTGLWEQAQQLLGTGHSDPDAINALCAQGFSVEAAEQVVRIARANLTRARSAEAREGLDRAGYPVASLEAGRLSILPGVLVSLIGGAMGMGLAALCFIVHFGCTLLFSKISLWLEQVPLIGGVLTIVGAVVGMTVMHFCVSGLVMLAKHCGTMLGNAPGLVNLGFWVAFVGTFALCLSRADLLRKVFAF